MIPSLVKDAKEASHDPKTFGSKFLIKEVRGSIIAGPYGIVKFLFWLIVIPSFFFLPFVIFSIRATTRALNRFPKEIKVKEI